MTDINPIQPLNQIKIPEIPELENSPPANLNHNIPAFGKVLSSYINDVSSLQHNATESLQKLATGEIKDVHQVMIAMNEAGVAFKLMMEIRNKLVQAYKQIIRTPV